MNVAAEGESLALDQAFDGDSLYALRAAVAAHGSQAGLSEGRTRDLVLAVHELAANAVRCEITDEGVPGEAGEADAALWRPEPGHGLWLVHRIADSASVQSGASGTVAAVIFRRVRS